MGFSLKKTIDKAKGYLFGSEGPSNAYAPPDLSYLRTALTPPDYSRLLNPSQYFGEYVNKINAPSSVDAVRTEMNQEGLRNTLQGIEDDTRKGYGSRAVMDFQRGLLDPGAGASSDIAAIGQANVANAGARRSADARLSYGLADLERLGAREQEMRDAYGLQYSTQNQNLQDYYSLLSGDLDRQNQRDIAYATGQAGLYNAGQQNRTAGRKEGLWDRINLSFGGGK